MSIFEELESEVRSYCRDFPEEFNRAQGSYLYSSSGKEYLDFFSGAGALNYGHNNPKIINPIINYLQENGVIHALDMNTTAKKEFLETFDEVILKPRELDYKVMFCGPTGTNAVEAAIKLARKVTGRDTVFAFFGSFHGMTAGSLAVSSKKKIKQHLGSSGNFSEFFPYSNAKTFSKDFDSIDYIDSVLEDEYSGIEVPAAIILETVQAEGGVNVAETEWLKKLRKLCDKYGIVLIVDDIQVGNGRTGNFFSFERADIVPDMVTLSKSISGSGLPMSLLLINEDMDAYYPGEHNGTFRGNQLAFIGAREALKLLEDEKLLDQVKHKEELVNNFIKENILNKHPEIEHRGIGLIHGLDFNNYEIDELALDLVHECFNNQLIIENAGKNGNVLKILPALTISDEDLLKGLNIIKDAIDKRLETT